MKVQRLRLILGINDENSDFDDHRLLSLYLALSQTRYLSPRTRNPVEEPRWSWFLLRMYSTSFKVEFRMSRSCFNKVVELIRGHDVFKSTRAKKQAPVEHQLLVALKRFGFSRNGSATGIIARTFSISYGCAYSYIQRCITAIHSLRNVMIVWPNIEDRDAIADRIEQRYGFPHCIGFVDGTLSPLASKPQHHGEDYYTRKACYAMNGLVVCDDQRKIR